jgi:hypothetical protein
MSSSIPHGKLILYVKEALLTRDTEIFAKMDPYAMVRLGPYINKTTVHEGGGKKPKWN